MAQTVSELALRLNRRNAKGRNFPPLILMTDAQRLPDPSGIISQLPAGSAVIVRHFTQKQKLIIINKIKYLCKKHKVLLLVSDDIRLALSRQLDGVHFSERCLKKMASAGRSIKAKPSFLYTSACHSYTALVAAERAKVDAVLISPVFPTDSHPNCHFLNMVKFNMLLKNTRRKVYALGGIKPRTAQRLQQTSITGFAGISNLA